MDAKLSRRMTLLLAVFLTGATVILWFHTAKLSLGLFLLSCAYVAVVLIRDYVLKVDLHSRTGIRFFIFQLAMALTISVWSESFIPQVYVLILIGEFTFHQSRNQSILFAISAYCCTLLGILAYRRFPPFEEVIMIIPRIIEYFAVFGMSLLARIAYQQKNRLARDNELLRQASAELERKAKLQERTRISREIHDSVGHTLTAAITGLQTASHAIGRNNYPLAQEMIDRTAQQIRGGLNDVRSSVHLLRENVQGQPFIPELVRLIEETEQQARVEIVREIERSLPELPPLIEITIFRALQEGLTNGIRHGSCTRFEFSLKLHDGRLRFRLSDNGRSPLPIVPGFGLNAMQERVEEVGGALTISKKEESSGVTLEIAIPLHPHATERREQVV